MERVDEHCSSCGHLEGVQCTCPCHTWKHRRCSCGGIMELIEFRGGVKLKLNGDIIPHIKVYEAKCKACGVEYRRKGEMMADEE